jgi:hypothetical protein
VLWDAEPGHPAAELSGGTAGCQGGVKGDCLLPAGRAIQDDEQVGVSARRHWKWAYQVNVKAADRLNRVDDVLGSAVGCLITFAL